VKSFAFVASDDAGQRRQGQVSASDEAEAVAQLTRQGLFPSKVAEVTGRFSIGGKASRKDLSLAFRSLASLTAIGVPLAEAVRSTERLTKGPLRAALGQVVSALREGQTLSAGLAGAGVPLPPAAVGMLRAAERGSRLDAGLAQIASALERDDELIGRVRQALAYPILLLTVGLFSVGLIAGVVVPRFAALLADLGQEPPLATRVLLGVARVARQSAFLVLPMAALGVAGLIGWAGTPAGRRTVHRRLLRLPLLGPLAHQLASGRVSEALGQMLETGVPLLTALDTAAIASANADMETRLARVRGRVAHGEPLGHALDREAALTDDVIRLAILGESSGKLGEMLIRAGQLALSDAERRIRGLVSLLEPVMILGFALVIGFVAAALLQAVYALRPVGGG